MKEVSAVGGDDFVEVWGVGVERNTGDAGTDLILVGTGHGFSEAEGERGIEGV